MEEDCAYRCAVACSHHSSGSWVGRWPEEEGREEVRLYLSLSFPREFNH
jgi:hypothetical protein